METDCQLRQTVHIINDLLNKYGPFVVFPANS